MSGFSRRQMAIAEEYHRRIMKLKKLERDDPELYQKKVKELQKELRERLKSAS